MFTRSIRTAALALSTLLIMAGAAQAATFNVLAPRNFVRTNGAPQTERVTFTVSNTSIPHTLRLQNGGAANNFSQVTSAVVTLNGVQLFGPGDFNAQLPVTVDRPVTLTASNELAVEVRGSPGSGFTLSILGEDNELPVIEATVTPAQNLEFWNNGPVTVNFTCSDAISGISACASPVTVTAEGSRTITGTATDRAGNIATADVVVNIDTTPGTLAILSPTATIVNTANLEITGTLTDALSGPGDVQCNGMPGSRGIEQNDTSIRCRLTVSAGPQTINVRATDRAGNASEATVNVVVDLEKPALVVESPGPAERTNVATLEVTGTVSDDDQIARVYVADTVASVANGRFTSHVALTKGSNPILVSAYDRAGNLTSVTLDITRFSLPEVAITSPLDLGTVRDAAVTVTGTLSDAVSVTVNGVAASISGETFTASGIALAQGRTVVTATATSDDGTVASASIFVYRDAIPPRVVLRAPLDGAVLFAPSVAVSGMIDDIVVGTVNSTQATVTVNGVVAEVANRAFVAANVPLVPGANTLVIAATDQGGNSSTLTATVTYDAAPRAKISLISGNGQSADIRTLLPLPLVVKLTNADGTPAANRPVTFEVVENNGKLIAGEAEGSVVSIQTGANGTAQVAWFLGGHAGAGNNRVRAASPGFAGAVEFQATAHLGPPRLIVVDAGNAQYGAFGAPLPRPIVVAVVDEGSNRLPNVPVTFSVAGGGGSIDGHESAVVRTDSDGRAWITPSLGQEVLNTFVAKISGSTASVNFQAFGKLAGPAAETRISGVILDNTDLPIPGVSIRIDGTAFVTQADSAGQFTIEGAPVGYVKLLIDGSTAQRPGTWPMLEYAMFTIPGANNAMEMPIFLLPIDTRRGLFTDEVTGGTLTLPELPGFSLTVKPGSATFPGGGRTGTVSVTLVHADKMPMTPGFGQQPRFIVTIQPPGVHFDPPAAITFPNVDGYSPNEVTEMYSFDHDLGQFVSIGTATISADGTTMVSDPGVGIIKGGWHCGGNPASSGTAADCPECTKCIDGMCTPQDGAGCDDEDVCTTNDKCEGGACKGKPVPSETLPSVTHSYNVDKVMQPLFKVVNALGMEGNFALQASLSLGGVRECCNRLGGQKVDSLIASFTGSIGATWEGPTPLSITLLSLGKIGLYGVVGVSGNLSGSAKQDKCNNTKSGTLAVTASFTFGAKLYLVKLPKDVLTISGGASSGGTLGWQGTWDGSQFSGDVIFGHNGVTASAAVTFGNGFFEWTGAVVLIEPDSFVNTLAVPFTM